MTNLQPLPSLSRSPTHQLSRANESIGRRHITELKWFLFLFDWINLINLIKISIQLAKAKSTLSIYIKITLQYSFSLTLAKTLTLGCEPYNSIPSFKALSLIPKAVTPEGSRSKNSNKIWISSLLEDASPKQRSSVRLKFSSRWGLSFRC